MIDKRRLDLLGGLGSISAGIGCVWLAAQHNFGPGMGYVWIVTAVILVVNGILMWAHARLEHGLPGLVNKVTPNTPPGELSHGTHKLR